MNGILKCHKFLYSGRRVNFFSGTGVLDSHTSALLLEPRFTQRKLNENKRKVFEQLVIILDSYANAHTAEQSKKPNVTNVCLSSTKTRYSLVADGLSGRTKKRTFNSANTLRSVTGPVASLNQNVDIKSKGADTERYKQEAEILLSGGFVDEESELFDSDISVHDDEARLEEIGNKHAIEDIDPDVIKNGSVNELTEEIVSCSKESKSAVKHSVSKTKGNARDKRKTMSVFEKERNLAVNLKTFCDVCINAKLIKKAHSALFHYCLKGRKCDSLPRVKDTEIYDIVLSGWSSKGQLAKIKEIFELMRKEEVPFSLQSFASYLECIARQKDNCHSKVASVLEMMKDKGYSCDDIFIKCKFIRDQKEKVIEAIQQCIPDYQPKPPPLPSGYSCDLLKNLNDKSTFHHPSILPSEVSASDLKAWLAKQIDMEAKTTVPVQTVSSHRKINDYTRRIRKQLQKYEEEWRASVKKIFIKNRAELSMHVLHYPGISLYPYLAVMPIDTYVDILMDEVRKLASLSENYSPGLSYLHRELGERVMKLYFLWNKKQNGVSEKLVKLYDKFLEYYASPELRSCYSTREYWEVLKSQDFEGPSVDQEVVNWPYHIQLGVGRFLYNVLLSGVLINVKLFKPTEAPMLLPAFHCVYRYKMHMRLQIKPDPVIAKLYRDAALEEITFETNLLPMLTPPLPWTSVNAGGFLFLEMHFVRLPMTAIHQTLLLKSTPPDQLHPTFDALNVLGSCAWIINKPMLDLAIEVFNGDGCEELDIPKPPSSLPLAPKYHRAMSQETRSLIKQERRAVKRKNAETYSLWCDMLYKLSVANHFRDQVFWFPHNMDFRGRIYPTPPHFNHLGGDIARSMLLFARGEPLGKDGLDWLKIHLVNLTGLKKHEPVSKRLQYANEMIEEILDSADFPFTGRKWWMKSDEPWQTLACCKEIAAAIRSQNPAAYVSHFPIHQDGSCNGLQHYAALGRDQQGAEQVNLHPSDRPQDVYSGVAAIVERERAKDAADGIKIAQVLEGHVKRKVVKQTVMTVVYGVTRYGARLQILKQLEDLPEFPQEYCHEAASYLVQKTFLSLEEMFTATKEIQDWFTECAKGISRLRGQPVQWVTPLGFPVTQPYHKPIVSQTLPCLKKEVSSYVSRCNFFTLPNVLKQKNAFAPNFIHSLDSSHMMLTALFCEKEGIAFVSVHDCYWTHAKDVKKMNEVCREQFVALHSQPILDNLSASFCQKYAFPKSEIEGNSHLNLAKKNFNLLLSSVPKKGKFKLQNVLQSTYFFS